MSNPRIHLPSLIAINRPKTIMMAIWLCALGAYGVLLLKLGMVLTLVVVVVMGSLTFLVFKPELATLAVMFVLYANFAAIAHQFYGVPKPLAAAVALPLIIPLLTYTILRRQRLVVDRGFVLMLVFLACLIASSFLAKDPMVALGWMGQFLVEGLLVYFLVTNVIRKLTTLKRVIWSVLLAGALMGALSLFWELTGTHIQTGTRIQYEGQAYGQDTSGFAQQKGQFAVDESRGQKIVRTRSAGLIGEPNRYAQIMVVLLPLAIFRFWGERSRFLRLAAAGLTGLILVGILLSFSRMGFLTIVLLLLIMTFMRYLKPSQVFSIALVFAVLVLVAVPDYVVRMESLGRIGGLFSKTTEAPDEAVLGRVAQNLAALRVFLQNPILGVGPGNFAKFYSTQFVNALSLIHQNEDYRAHSLYLEIAAETGLMGFTAFMAIVWVLMHQLWQLRVRWSQRYPDLANLATAFLLALIAYLATGVFLHLSYSRYFWLLMALSGAAIRTIGLEAWQRAHSVKPLRPAPTPRHDAAA